MATVQAPKHLGQPCIVEMTSKICKPFKVFK